MIAIRTRKRNECRKVSSKGRSLRFVAATRSRVARLTIKISKGSKVDVSEYAVSEIGSQIGRGFIIGKVGGDVYETHVGGQGLCSCTCPGFEFGFSCRHVDAMSKVIELGFIPGGTP